MSPISLELNEDNAGECSRVGGQGAVGRGNPHHYAPIFIEVITEADIVPLRIYPLVGVERRGGSGATDVVLRLIAAPEFKENPPAMVLLLWKIKATDVEYAATACACERLCGGQTNHDEGRQKEHRNECKGGGNRSTAAQSGLSAMVGC